MGNKKVFLVSKVQLRQGMLLHASAKTGDAARLLALEKGSGGPSHPVPLRPISQVPLVDPASETNFTGGLGQLVQLKRRRLGN